MTETIIQAILESSFMAGIAAVVVMLLRIPMRKLPRKWSYMLWAVVFFRCLCPFSAESEISIFNVLNTSEQSASVQITEAVVYDSQETYLTDENTINIFDTIPGQYASEQSTSVQITESLYDDNENYVTEYYVRFPDDDPVYKDYSGNAAFNKTVAVADAVPGTASTKGQMDRDTVILIIWATVVLVMVWYAVVSYTLLMQKVSAAVKMPDGVYETDRISTAFTAGFFVPKIYLSCGLSENERRLIIAHEKVHIKRFDIITKPLAFAGLALHWFNPLIWAAFALMSRDMEFSCDEAVLEMLGSEEKEDYSEALLRASMKKSGLAAFPLAFAEIGIKERVENVLKYKKQKVIGAVLSAAIVLTACAALGTDPVSGYGEPASDTSIILLEGDAVYSDVWDHENGSEEQTQQEEQIEYEEITWSYEAEEQEFLKKFRDFSFDIDLEQAVPYGLGITYPEANTVYLFSTPADGINMYGYDYNGRFPIVIIEHDGITDAFMENWTSRMFPAVAFCSDYDGDGENEIAACYHIGHGTGANVYELVLYKKNESGHFIEYKPDPAAVKNSVDISVNNSTREITYELNGISFTNSYPEGGIVDGYFHDSGGVKPEYISFETRVSYCLDGNNIMLMISPDLLTVYSGPDIIADVRFTGSGFNIENVRFDEPVPYDESLIKQYTYPDGTVEDYIITANSIIPAGDLAAETEYSEAFHGVEMISDTAERSVSVSESGNKSYAVYASDAGYSVKTFDVLISYPDGTMEEFSIAEDQLSEISGLSSAEYSVAISEAPDTAGHLAEDTDSEYSSTGESTAEYPVYITVDEALSSNREDVVLHQSGEYTMSKLYEPYGMYYDYQKNCYIYNGEPVRFFYDSVEKASFTNYFTGTIDLEAVYENDVLVGITECSDEVYAIHDEKQAMFSSVLTDTSIVVLPDASLVMVQ